MNYTIENLNSSHYENIINNINDWWGGRNMADMLPQLFFKYFNDTSFVIKVNDQITGFLVGFISQVNPSEAYVHFIGVHPDKRGQGIGKQLYNAFFELVKGKGVISVACVTSPHNKNSIRFHEYIGFKPVDAESITSDQIPYFLNYDGKGAHRVVLEKDLTR